MTNTILITREIEATTLHEEQIPSAGPDRTTADEFVVITTCYHESLNNLTWPMST
jgi:hypothetical protein